MSLARYLAKISQLINSSGQVLNGGIADGAVDNAKISGVASGKVSGLAASATTDTTNANNISSGSLAIARGGSRVIKVHTYENTTRQVTSVVSNYTFFSWTLTKVSSTSDLYIHGFMPGVGNTNSGDYIGIGIDGTMSYSGVQNFDIGASYGGGNGTTFVQKRTGLASGNRSMTIQAIPNDGTANRTVDIVNQNSSDDARNRQMGSVFIVYEVENA